MPKFFLPAATDAALSEKNYAIIRKNAETSMGWKISDRQSFGVAFNHNGKNYYSEVGKSDGETGDTVIAIFEAPDNNACLVCTITRGVREGSPMLCEPISVVDFDTEPSKPDNAPAARNSTREDSGRLGIRDDGRPRRSGRSSSGRNKRRTKRSSRRSGRS